MALAVKIVYLPKVEFGIVGDDSARVTIGLLNLMRLVVIEPTVAATSAYNYLLLLDVGT